MMATVAGRYASALLELASETGKVDEVEAELLKFQELLDQSSDLQRLVRSPVFRADDQSRGLTAVLDMAGIGGLTANFFKVLIRNRRLFAAPDMIKAFRTLTARARGEAAAEVTSAIALTPEQSNLLKETLSASVGKQVQLTERVDPALLGGLVVKIGSRMIDSSIRTKLNALKTRMKEAN
jgi:F-type H+-transporting ATPase subunit delta